jgi:hypothetical protein
MCRETIVANVVADTVTSEASSDATVPPQFSATFALLA